MLPLFIFCIDIFNVTVLLNCLTVCLHLSCSPAALAFLLFVIATLSECLNHHFHYFTFITLGQFSIPNETYFSGQSVLQSLRLAFSFFFLFTVKEVA